MGDRSPRAALFHPIALGALALLLVNDHFLKAAWPGWWTGKLSDVAALIVGPIAVAALVRAVVRRRGPGSLGAGIPVEAGVAVAFAIAFAAVKLEPHANAAYAAALGAFGWPIGIVGDLLAGRPIQGLGRAPTVLDPGDLVALPAIAVGWWLARGGPIRPIPRCVRVAPPVERMARIAVLGAAWVALAATSATPPPTSQTTIARDAVTVAPGAAPVERLSTIRIPSAGGTADTGPRLVSVRAQARPLWPFNDPPAHLTLSIDGVGSAAGDAPVVDIPADRCEAGCELAVTVGVDWPAPGSSAPSSVAWELAVTVDTNAAGYSGGAPRPSVDGSAFLGPLASANTTSIAVAGLVVLAALVAGSLARRRISRWLESASRARRPVEAIFVAATIVLAVGLVWIALTVRLAGPGSPLIDVPDTLKLLCLGAATGLLVGLAGWLRGDGEPMTAVAFALGLVGLSTAGAIVAAASPTFADRGNIIGAVAGSLLAIVAFLAAARRMPDRPPASAGRAVFVGTQLGLMAAMLLGAGDRNLGGGVLGVLLLASALAIWLEGSGWLLGFTSLAILAVAGGSMFLGGPSLFGPRWSTADQIVQAVVAAGAVIGLGAAIGLVRSEPPPEPWRPTPGAAAAVAWRDPEDGP